MATCGHSFCRLCAVEYLEGAAAGTAATCPSCASPLTINLAVGGEAPPQSTPAGKSAPGRRGHGQGRGSKYASGILSRIDLPNFQSSTKIEALREEIQR